MQRSAVAFSKCRWEIFVCKQAQKLDLEQARRRGYVDANGSDTRSRCGPLTVEAGNRHQAPTAREKCKGRGEHRSGGGRARKHFYLGETTERGSCLGHAHLPLCESVGDMRGRRERESVRAREAGSAPGKDPTPARATTSEGLRGGRRM